MSDNSIYLIINPASELDTDMQKERVEVQEKFWGRERTGGLVADENYDACRKSLDGSDEMIIETSKLKREGETNPYQAIRDLLSDPKFTVNKYTHAEILLIKVTPKWHKEIEEIRR